MSPIFVYSSDSGQKWDEPKTNKTKQNKNFEESCHLKGREGRFESYCCECKASTFTLGFGFI